MEKEKEENIWRRKIFGQWRRKKNGEGKGGKYLISKEERQSRKMFDKQRRTE